jgi:hypothetical protein
VLGGDMNGIKVFVWTCMIVGYATLFIIPFWRILKKAGFTPWLFLLMAIPFINFFMFYVLAFVRWPISKQSSTS